MRDMVLIIDYEPSASQSVRRRLRAEHIYCKIVSPFLGALAIREEDASGLILSAGTGELLAPLDPALFEMGLPILCLGACAREGLRVLGGVVAEPVVSSELLPMTYEPCALFEGLTEQERFLSSVHMLMLPPDIRPIAWAQECVAVWQHQEKSIFGAQILIERNDPDGSRLLANFAQAFCGATLWWSAQSFITRSVQEITRVAGNRPVVCAISGGLGSMLCAAIAQRALGDRAIGVIVDTGLLREGEAEQVEQLALSTLGMRCTRLNVADELLTRLDGITHPDEKEKVIRTCLQMTLEAFAASRGVPLILTGECGNQRPLQAVDEPDISWLSPLYDLFRDEARDAAIAFPLPPEATDSKPFPLSGLALYLIGEVTAPRLTLLRHAEDTLAKEIADASLLGRLSHFYPLLMNADCLGESGEQLIIHAKQKGENPLPARLPYDLLERFTQSMTKSHPSIRRIYYDLTTT